MKRVMYAFAAGIAGVALMAITPARADIFSDTVYLNGDPIFSQVDQLQNPAPGFTQVVEVPGQVVPVPEIAGQINQFVTYVFTQPGTGTGTGAVVSDILFPTYNFGTVANPVFHPGWVSDPTSFEIASLAGACPDTPTAPCTIILEETGGVQPVSSTVRVQSDVDIPGPLLGGGLPGVVLACGGLLALWRRRAKAA